MADTKITALTAITTVDPAADVLPIVDVSDTSMAASGTTKKITSNQILGAGGTATLASATITGDLTVDTSTLYVSSSSDKVGIGTTSLSNEKLTVAGNISANAWLGRSNIAAPAGDCSIFRSADNTLGFGIASTTAMTLNSTGLGVGGSPTSKLSVFAGADGDVGFFRGGSTRQLQIGTSATAGYLNADNGSAGFELRVNGTARAYFDTSGNVGIGVTPSAWNSAYRAIEIAKTGNAIFSNNASNNNILFTQNAYYDGSWKYGYTALAAHYEIQNGAHKWNTAASGTAGNAITWTQAMTLDASGNLLVRCTTAGAEQLGVQVIGYTNGNYVRINHNSSAASGDSYLNFLYNATQIGSITQNGTTGVLYNITSDYRLKESVQPLVGGLARVNALKPSVYKWKSDGSSGEGFLAHELAEVVPFAVTGEKDAVNEDGSIKSQGIDMSRVVPILVAAIQELTARVQTLETR